MTTLSILHGASGIGAATLLGIGADMSDSYTKRAPMTSRDTLFFDEWEGGGGDRLCSPRRPFLRPTSKFGGPTSANTEGGLKCVP